MKKLLLAILPMLGLTYSYAHNTFPTTDNVGIGIATPAATLDVVGTGNFSGNLSLGGNFKISTTGPLVQYYHTSAFATGHLIRTQYIYNNSLGAYVDAVTTNNTSTPLVDFVWNTFNGSQFAGVMTLKSTGRLLLGTNVENTGRAMIQATVTSITTIIYPKYLLLHRSQKTA